MSDAATTYSVLALTASTGRLYEQQISGAVPRRPKTKALAARAQTTASQPRPSYLTHVGPPQTHELGNIVPGVFTPVLAKHSKSFSLVDAISVGVDRMQWNFEPMLQQVEVWRQAELTDVTAKMIIYDAFIEANSRFLAISRGVCTICISIRSMMTSSRGGYGACQMRSKIWARFTISGNSEARRFQAETRLDQSF
jgi:hypothetical protein